MQNLTSIYRSMNKQENVDEATEIVRKADVKPEKYVDSDSGKVKMRNRRKEIKVQTEAKENYIVVEKKSKKPKTKEMSMEMALDAYESMGGNAKGLAVVKASSIKEEQHTCNCGPDCPCGGDCGPDCNCTGCSSVNESVKLPKGISKEQKKHVDAFLKTAKGQSPAAIKAGIEAILKHVKEEKEEKEVPEKKIKGKKDELDMKPSMKDERMVQEKTLTDTEKKKKEEIVKSMKKKYESFQNRYGDNAKSVMYATATKLAKREGFEYDFIEEDFIDEAMKPYVSSAGGKHYVLNSSGKSVAEYKNINQANAHLEKHYDKLSKSHK